MFGLSLKEAKDAVDSGEFIPQCECECILLNKEEYEKERKELMKYKSLYLDLVGSIHSIIDTFPKE